MRGMKTSAFSKANTNSMGSGETLKKNLILGLWVKDLRCFQAGVWMPVLIG
jgi:hypothetical protein